jgi:hypothetical protein
MMLALARAGQPRADEEEEEKTVTSNAARVARDAIGNVVVVIAPDVQKEIGIATEILVPTVRPVEVEAYGFVLDPSALAKLNSDLLSAHAALDAAVAQYRRTKHLYEEQKNASLRDVQAAQASYLTDKNQVKALEQQLRNDWGRQVAQMDSQGRSLLVSALIDRREAMARVTAPIGKQPDDVPRTAQLLVLGHEGQPLNARAVYPAPTVVPTLQGQSFIVLVTATEFPVRPGAAVSAKIPTSNTAQQGVLVRRSAVVRYAGNEWVYRKLDDDRFVRVEIIPTEITQRGYFVTEKLAPGMQLVITGAQTLLSEELKAGRQVVE